MDKIKQIAINTKNHLKTNRYTYAASAVALAAIALQQSNRKAFYAFLESKDIDPTEFYCPEYFEEKNL